MGGKMCNLEERKAWIDILRGFCMMAILYFHTEMYYAGKDLIPYACYVDNMLSVFFFISGYLMLKENSGFNAIKKLRSIVRGLVVPYFFFTLIMALPKAFMHGEMGNSLDFFFDVITGHASWFVAALIVCELVMTLWIKMTKGSVSSMICLAAFCLLLSMILANQLSPWYNEYNIWHVNEAMLGCVFMSVGYLYHKYEGRCDAYLYKSYIILALLIVVLGTKYIILTESLQMVFGPVIVSSFPLFIIDNLAAVLLLTICFKRMPSVSMVEWTGRHSIVYYFICGGVPLLISTASGHIGITYNGFFSVIPIYIIVYFTATIISWLAYRYLPAILSA